MRPYQNIENSDMSDPETIHEWVREFNWDDDLTPIWAIVHRADTEFATALIIYWRLEGPWISRSDSNSDAVDLHDFVEATLLSGGYAKGSICYDPVADNALSRVQVAKLKRSGFPSQLLEPIYKSESGAPDSGSQP